MWCCSPLHSRCRDYTSWKWDSFRTQLHATNVLCIPHWKGLVAAGRKKVPGRESRGGAGFEKGIVVAGGEVQQPQGLEFRSQHSCNKSDILGNVCHPQLPESGWRKDEGCWDLPASGLAETNVSCSGRAFMLKEKTGRDGRGHWVPALASAFAHFHMHAYFHTDVYTRNK